jgi:hypothetical protein
MLVIHVINGKIYAMNYSVMDSPMKRISLDEAIELMKKEMTP